VGDAGGGSASVTALFIATTVEGEQPDAQTDACLRFIRRQKKGEEPGLLLAGLRYAVLGLGDSNHLGSTWRSIVWASARDCNQAGELLDAWLAQRGGTRFLPRGEADDRTGSQAVEPWLESFWSKLAAQ